MPIVAELEMEQGRKQVRGALGVVFPCLGALLGLLVILCSFSALLIGECCELNYKWRVVCHLTPLLMPYAVFICLTGAMTAVTNYAGTFVKPAFYSLAMNIFLVGGLLWGWC
jgi:peptidoglycan biosynthesis protein MviN/MurJ (putative lipid II flippase)